VGTSLDDEAEVVVAGELYRGDDIPGGLRCNGEDARLRRPGIDPASGLRQRDVVADVIWVLQSGEEVVACQADWVAATNTERRPDLDQATADIAVEPLPACGGGPPRIAGPDPGGGLGAAC
jgi:hypothetical protein